MVAAMAYRGKEVGTAAATTGDVGAVNFPSPVVMPALPDWVAAVRADAGAGGDGGSAGGKTVLVGGGGAQRSALVTTDGDREVGARFVFSSRRLSGFG